MVSHPSVNRNFILLGLFILALTIKLLIFFFATDPIIFIKYPYFAKQIAQGLDIGERLVDLSPVYLYINVIFYQICGADWEMLAILQILIGSLNCLFIYAIGEKLFGKRIGLIAAIILVLYGNITLIELILEPETFVIFFSSLTVLALIRAKNDPSSGHNFWKWFLAGMLLGLSGITKPNALLTLPGALIWIWWGIPKSNKRMIATLSLLLGVTLVVSPVTIRNYMHFKDFILVTADGGKVFFHGNGPGATGMERADLAHQGFIEEGQAEPDYAHVLFRNGARTLSGAPLTPSKCSHFWVDRALGHMATYPAQALFLELKKFCFFWGNYEVHDVDSTYKNYVTIQSWPLIPFGLIAALGVVGMGLSIKRFREAFLLYWTVLIYLISVLVFFAASRYRLPAIPFLCIFAACVISDLFLHAQDKNWKKCGAYLGIIMVVIAGTNFPFRDEIKRFDQWQQATRIHYSLGGIMLFKKGLYPEAIREFQKTIALQPGLAPAYNYLGKSYAMLSDYKQAEEAFKRVVQLAPDIDIGYMNLGLLYELKGDTSQAILYIRKALSLNPENAKARKHLEAMHARDPGE